MTPCHLADWLFEAVRDIRQIFANGIASSNGPESFERQFLIDTLHQLLDGIAPWVAEQAV